MIKKSILLAVMISFFMVLSANAQEAEESASSAVDTAPQAKEAAPPVADTEAPTVNIEQTINIQNPPPEEVESDEAELEDEVKESQSVGMKLLLYLPNRVFDIFDIVRARVRIGPGLSIGARTTEEGVIKVGAYRSVWLGLHGSRGEPKVPWPVGLEGSQGNRVLFMGEVKPSPNAPNYEFDEIALSGQAAVAGAAVGFSISELFDFALGFLFIDISDDDF
jgi:hypothetical protein